MFHEGKGVKQDLNLARIYYDLAAQQGDKEALLAISAIDNQ